jgi:hypothetical protein
VGYFELEPIRGMRWDDHPPFMVIAILKPFISGIASGKRANMTNWKDPPCDLYG